MTRPRGGAAPGARVGGAAWLAPLLAVTLASAAGAQPAQTSTRSAPLARPPSAPAPGATSPAPGVRQPMVLADASEAAPEATSSPPEAASSPSPEAASSPPKAASSSPKAASSAAPAAPAPEPPTGDRATKPPPATTPAGGGAASKVSASKPPRGGRATKPPPTAALAASAGASGGTAKEAAPASAPGAPAGAALKRLRERLSLAGRPEEILQEFGRVAQRYVPVQEMEGLTDPLSLLLLALLAAIVARSARKLRGKLLRSGIIPRLLLVLSIAGRFIALSAGVLVGIRLAPHWLGAAVPWVLLAAALAVGWSLRDLFPDLLAGIVVLSERRIRPGVWVTGEGFSGSVDRLGPRAAWLRTAAGERISVPNHRLLAAPVMFRDGQGAHHETALVVGLGLPAETVRAAIEEASGGSPWVALRPALSVERDSLRADHWRVRVRLLDLRYAPHFDGELLERTEEALRVARQL